MTLTPTEHHARKIYEQVIHRALSIQIDAVSEGRKITLEEAERQAVRELAPTLKVELARHAKSKHRPTEQAGKSNPADELKAKLDRINVDALIERVAELEAVGDAPARKSISRYRSKRLATPEGARATPPGRPSLAVIEGGASTASYGVVRPRRARHRYQMIRTPDGRRWLKRNFKEYE